MKVHIDLETLTLGDMELLETGRVTEMLQVFDKRLRIEGVAPEDVPATVRGWTLADLQEISETIKAEFDAQSNPVRKGKN